MRVLGEPDLASLDAGIVLQACPESHERSSGWRGGRSGVDQVAGASRSGW
jgi:hypothetical protein